MFICCYILAHICLSFLLSGWRQIKASPAQLLLEEASVKQLTGKKGTAAVQQFDVPPTTKFLQMYPK
jgi:hypothetical protein